MYMYSLYVYVYTYTTTSDPLDEYTITSKEICTRWVHKNVEGNLHCAPFMGTLNILGVHCVVVWVNKQTNKCDWYKGNSSSNLKLILGCNNGSGGGNFSKVMRLVLECMGTQKRLFSGFSSFSLYTVGFVKCRYSFQGLILPIKPRVRMCPCSKAVGISKKVGCRPICAGDGRFCGSFPPFFILAPRNQTCHFFYCT